MKIFFGFVDITHRRYKLRRDVEQTLLGALTALEERKKRRQTENRLIASPTFFVCQKKQRKVASQNARVRVHIE